MSSNMLHNQYKLIKESRNVVFDFLESKVEEDIHKPLEIFNGKTIAYLYLHIANTYIAWAVNFALSGSDGYYDQGEQKSLQAIKDIFHGVDEFMFQYCHQFSENHLTPVHGEKWPGKYIETNALDIFTHVISHEFHHKGQAMTMARLLGYTPPDTDVMRF